VNCIVGFDPLNFEGGCDTPIAKILSKPLSGAQTSLLVKGSTDIDSNTGLCTGPSCGRYCWSVWPLFEDSKGKPLPRQPLVELDRHCYTSDPSTPIISV